MVDKIEENLNLWFERNVRPVQTRGARSFEQHYCSLGSQSHCPTTPSVMSSAVQYNTQPPDIPTAAPESVFLVHNRALRLGPPFFNTKMFIRGWIGQ